MGTPRQQARSQKPEARSQKKRRYQKPEEKAKSEARSQKKSEKQSLKSEFDEAPAVFPSS
jgi:hypothetical protein